MTELLFNDKRVSVSSHLVPSIEVQEACDFSVIEEEDHFVFKLNDMEEYEDFGCQCFPIEEECFTIDLDENDNIIR